MTRSSPTRRAKKFPQQKFSGTITTGPRQKVGKMVVKQLQGPDLLLPLYPPGHPRAQHLLNAILLKRKMLANAYRYVRQTGDAEKRADMRKQINEMRRARKGWASA